MPDLFVSIVSAEAPPISFLVLFIKMRYWNVLRYANLPPPTITRVLTFLIILAESSVDVEVRSKIKALIYLLASVFEDSLSALSNLFCRPLSNVMAAWCTPLLSWLVDGRALTGCPCTVSLLFSAGERCKGKNEHNSRYYQCTLYLSRSNCIVL